ncbi:NADH-quinone oxidoreductase subunit L [candidate division LCP-89 bacterium B3_LCP]|uniref:NADH-quinone oxidoreductase subunit L n=1 Tax=candidate division LCP-89 bacterium B3_LCP TaxID=2012998 RepID=A0A532V5U4_UNCL8|nr:MAG: NADH-quinone oxidoreductase subunit L [candidate division LCP-89 bacterium B3_LCP]
MITEAIIILLAPIIAFTIVIFIGKRLPRGGDWVSLAAIFLGLILALHLLSRMLGEWDPDFAISWQFHWFMFGDYDLTIGINLDNMAIMMLVVVTIVSSLVHLFSVGYMHGDVRYSRFFAYLSFFSFSMLGLVLADNIFIIFCFWELVGLSSYLLIGHWYEKKSASDAAVKAFVVNRIGDAGMIVGIMLVFTHLGTLNLNDIIAAVGRGEMTGTLLTVTGICLFCGAIGKSAQFPLHVWLPDAMEGPTPVSALIHAATMVAAGVYLTARIFPILSLDAGLVIAYVGGFTALFAATIAVAQNDIKRVLAYSTLSQLGYMVMALGAGAYTAGFFHLCTHAMFKAALFLGSGSVIHAMHGALHHIHSDADPQDMRNMGGLKKYMPKTYWSFLLATLALCGVPLTAGFLSKDAILGGTLAYAQLNPGNWLLPVFGFGAAILTAFYMFRLIYLTFFGKFRPGEEAEKHLHEAPANMTIPVAVMAGLSIFIFWSLPTVNPTSAEKGWFAHLFPTPGKVYEHIIPNRQMRVDTTRDDYLTLMVEPETSGSTEHHDEAEKHETHGHAVPDHDAEGHAVAGADHHDDHVAHVHHQAHTTAMIISIIMAGLGILLAYRTYYQWKISAAAWQKRLGIIYQGMFNKWWVDEIYDVVFVKGLHLCTKILAAFDLYVIDGIVNATAALWRALAFIHGIFDHYVIDGLANGIAWFVGLWGRFARMFQTGSVQRYMLITAVVVALFLLLRL